MNKITKNGFALLGLTLISSCARAQEATKTPAPKPPATKTPAPKPDYRFYMMGNSLTDQIGWNQFEKMVVSGKKKLSLGSHRVPGAPIGWLLDHPDGGFQHGDFGLWKAALTNYQWDALSLQPFQWGYTENIRDIPKILDVLYKKSPQADLLIYAQWPDSGRGGDWTRRWLAPRTEHIMVREEYEDTVKWLHANIKNRKPARLVPVGHVMHLLEQKAKAGLVPGMKTMWQLYDDGVHLNNVGSFIVGTTFYAMIFRANPVGLDYTPYAEGRMKLSPELAKVIQQTAWEVVTTHPMTRLSNTRKPEIATPVLEAAVQGSEYKGEIFAAFGKAPRVFKVKSGKLPDGMKLSTDGILTGAAKTTGNARFEVQVTDARGQYGTRALTLKVVPDTAPKIVTTSFPALQQGVFRRIELKANMDNAPLFWKVESGALPIGLRLNDGGFLEGAPGQAGPHEVTLSVTDGDSSSPETTKHTYTFNVAPSDKNVFMARRIDWKPDPNGKLDPQEKWQFKSPVSKVLQGKPNDSAPMIDVVYDKESIYVAVLVKDASLISKNGQPTDIEDQVRIYFDGKNNREAVYNWDDFRFINNPNGNKSDIRGGWWAWSNAGKVEGGYLVEAHLTWGSSGQLIKGENRDWLSVGLDVQVIDVDTDGGPVVSRVAWHGSLKNDTDPSGYRAVITKP